MGAPALMMSRQGINLGMVKPKLIQRKDFKYNTPTDALRATRLDIPEPRLINPQADYWIQHGKGFALDWRQWSITPFSFIIFFAYKIDSTGTYTGFLILKATKIILSNILVVLSIQPPFVDQVLDISLSPSLSSCLEIGSSLVFQFGTHNHPHRLPPLSTACYQVTIQNLEHPFPL
ncbi:hypothetical protein LguiB_027624 [Lonicera macranthoides]